jgi:IS30 family transposase
VRFPLNSVDLTDVQVYSDPQSPWQRGTNENTNLLLLRQYFPRGTDLAPITQAQLDQVSLRLNQRPRETLGFETPANKLHLLRRPSEPARLIMHEDLAHTFFCLIH